MPTKVLESYVCCRCEEAKPRDAYGTRSGTGGRKWRLTRCKACEVKRVAEKAIRHPLTALERRRRAASAHQAKARMERRNMVRIERFILWDSRSIDAKLGRKNDLTKENVLELISQPCSYCGETELRMTLDRIDNDIGHVLANVVGACVRCNYMRRHMPYKAWMCIVPGIRAAREAGLFEDWTGENHLRTPYVRPSDDERIGDLMDARSLAIQLVEADDFEPSTCCSQNSRSTN